MNEVTPKRVVVTDAFGKETVATVSDDATARHFEDLVLEPGGPIVKVVVTDAAPS